MSHVRRGSSTPPARYERLCPRSCATTGQWRRQPQDPEWTWQYLQHFFSPPFALRCFTNIYWGRSSHSSLYAPYPWLNCKKLRLSLVSGSNLQIDCSQWGHILQAPYPSPLLFIYLHLFPSPSLPPSDSFFSLSSLTLPPLHLPSLLLPSLYRHIISWRVCLCLSYDQ